MRTTTRIKRAMKRLKAVWSELKYADRRLFEIRTGIPVEKHRDRPRIARRVDELEALYLKSN